VTSTIEGNNFVGVTLEASVEEGNPLGACKPGQRAGHGGPGKTLKLAIFIFYKFLFQIWFQKYYISPNDT
jgi:hypothetical protein